MAAAMSRRRFIGDGARLLAGVAGSRSAATIAGGAGGLRVTTPAGDTVPVDGAALADLKRSLKGDVIVGGMADYDSARRIWNAAIDRKPAVIVRCVDVHDIVGAVRFGERHDAVMAVRAGGHHAAGFAMCDGGMVIDLTRLTGVDVDPARKIARVGGGATFADYDAATHQHGLASTGPIISMVGVAGYTLGGGLGWLHRHIGAASDNLAAAQIVTADGGVLDASPTKEADLFWAVRGGGGNFGVVSAFEFRLTPVARVTAGLVVHPLDALPDVAAFVRAFNDTAPDEVSVWLMLRRAPASKALPPELHGRPIAALGVCCTGSAPETVEALRRLRRFGRPLVDDVRLRDYPEWQRALDAAWLDGFGNHWDGVYLPELTDASARTLLDGVSRVTSPFSDVKIISMGGAVARVPDDSTAFGHRRSRYALAIQTRWAAGDAAGEHLDWSRRLSAAMQVHGTGEAYVNFMPDDGGRRVTEAYAPATLARLRAIKTTYDPRNRFRLNHNIQPAPRD
jgi:FAD/FMN-containing dehydrogenase